VNPKHYTQLARSHKQLIPVKVVCWGRNLKIGNGLILTVIEFHLGIERKTVIKVPGYGKSEPRREQRRIHVPDIINPMLASMWLGQ
jgi:hypothetical protein